MNPGLGASAGLSECEIDASGYKERPSMEKPPPMSESDKDSGALQDLSHFFPEDKNNNPPNKVFTNW